jgi:hypothetical protein
MCKWLEKYTVLRIYSVTYIQCYVYTVLRIYSVRYIQCYIYTVYIYTVLRISIVQKMYGIKSGQNSHPTFR